MHVMDPVIFDKIRFMIAHADTQFKPEGCARCGHSNSDLVILSIKKILEMIQWFFVHFWEAEGLFYSLFLTSEIFLRFEMKISPLPSV